MQKKKNWFSWLTWPNSAEAIHNSQIRSIFRLYVNEKIGYREAVLLIEKQWVDYQLSEATLTQKAAINGSALHTEANHPQRNNDIIIERAAASMGITQGALADIMKTVDLKIDDYLKSTTI